MASGARTSFMHRLELRNGRCTVDPGPTIEAASIRTLAALAACRNSLAFGSGAWGALGVCDGSDRRPATGHLHAPAGSDPRSSTPGASAAAPGVYPPSPRCESVRGRGFGITVDA